MIDVKNDLPDFLKSKKCKDLGDMVYRMSQTFSKTENSLISKVLILIYK